jgi:hypothetical protein
MRRYARLVAPLAALAAAAFVPSVALAQGDAPAAQPPAVAPAQATDSADAIKARGDAAMESLRYSEALDLYTQAYSLTKDPALLYNQGRAQQALGNFPGALTAFEGFAKEASPELRARVPKLDELIADVRKHVAHIVVHCATQGARVIVRERVAGTTPLAGPLDVDAGHAAIEVDAEGYVPYKRDVELAGGTETVLDVELTPQQQTAFLRISSTAASAFVSIDGKPVGNAPVEQVVSPGTHTVAVHRDGYEDTESSVVVLLGEHKDMTLDPQKNAPVFAKWWFWTGVGVVVAGGVVTAAALLTEKSPSKGDSFTPNQVSAPITRAAAFTF